MGLFDKKSKTIQKSATAIPGTLHTSAEAQAILGGGAPQMTQEAVKEDKAARKIQNWWKNGPPAKLSLGHKDKPKVEAASAHTGFSNAQVAAIDNSVDDFLATLKAPSDTVPVAIAAAAGVSQLSKEEATQKLQQMSEDEAARKIQSFWRNSLNLPLIELANRTTQEHVISRDQVHELRKYLPPVYRDASKWHLYYSLQQHGSSIHTMYDNLQENDGPIFLAIKTIKGGIFGAFCSEAIRPVKEGSGYYGTGESFLWRILPSEVKDGKERIRVQIHRATLHNDYYISTRHDCIVLGGGGNGDVALFIGADLLHGYSDGASPTYHLGGVALGDESILNNMQEGEIQGNAGSNTKTSFQISSLELWGFSL